MNGSIDRGEIELDNPKWSKILVSTIVLTTVFSPLAAVATTPIGTQVATTSGDAIQQARELGLLVGDPNGDIRTSDRLTRMELAKIFCSLFQLKVESGQASSFSDVTSDDWGLNYIEAAHRAGLMNGDGNAFRPNDFITREEMAVALVRGLGLDSTGKGSQLALADKAQISTWAQDAVQTVLELGLMQKSGDTFLPQQALVRQEVATVAVGVVDRPTGKVKVSAGTLTVAGISYQVSESLQGLLNVNNAAVLQNAKFELERDGYKIVGIKNLELQQQEGMLDAGNNVLNGNLSVKGSVTLKNLAAKGKVQVMGTADAQAHVILENATLSSVEAKDSQITARGTTYVADVVVKGGASITVEGNASFDQLRLAEGSGEVQLKGTLKNVVLEGSAHSKITLLEGAAIQNLTLPAGFATKDLFNQYDAVKSSIPMVNGSANPDLIVSSPGESVEHADRTALIAKIAEATALKNAAVVGTTPDTYPQAAMDAFVQAIAHATAMTKKWNASQSQVDAAVVTLQQAIVTFKVSVNQDAGDVTGALLAAITAAEALKGGSLVGNTTGKYPQSAVDALTQAIADAHEIADQEGTTQEEADTATDTLAQAVLKFQKACIVPLTVSLSPNAQFIMNSNLPGTAADVVISTSDMGPTVYNKRNIKNLIQIKRGTEEETFKYKPGTNTFEVDNAKGEEIAELSLSSSDIITLSSAPDGVNVHALDEVTEASEVSLLFTVKEDLKVVGNLALPIHFDETAPQLTAGSYANNQFSLTTSEPIQNAIGINPSVIVEFAADGNFDTPPLLLENNKDYYVKDPNGDQLVIVLTDAGKMKLAVQQGSKFRFTVQDYTDAATNALNSAFVVDVDQL
jgi:hypothetical protein